MEVPLIAPHVGGKRAFFRRRSALRRIARRNGDIFLTGKRSHSIFVLIRRKTRCMSDRAAAASPAAPSAPPGDACAAFGAELICDAKFAPQAYERKEVLGFCRPRPEEPVERASRRTLQEAPPCALDRPSRRVARGEAPQDEVAGWSGGSHGPYGRPERRSPGGAKIRCKALEFFKTGASVASASRRRPRPALLDARVRGRGNVGRCGGPESPRKPLETLKTGAKMASAAAPYDARPTRRCRRTRNAGRSP